MVLDMEEEDESPIILGRLFLNTTNAIIYVGSRQVHLQFPRERYDVISIVTVLMSSRRRTALGGNIDYPAFKRTNPNGMNMKNLKSLKNL
jgi:hypothetical protein